MDDFEGNDSKQSNGGYYVQRPDQLTAICSPVAGDACQGYKLDKE